MIIDSKRERDLEGLALHGPGVEALITLEVVEAGGLRVDGDFAGAAKQAVAARTVERIAHASSVRGRAEP